MFLGRRGNSLAGSIPVVRIIVNESLRVPCWNERRLFVLSERDKKIKQGIIVLDLKGFPVNPNPIKASEIIYNRISFVNHKSARTCKHFS